MSITDFRKSFSFRREKGWAASVTSMGARAAITSTESRMVDSFKCRAMLQVVVECEDMILCKCLNAFIAKIVGVAMICVLRADLAYRIGGRVIPL